MSEGNKPTTKPSMRGYPALNALVARLDAFFAEKFPEGANQIEKGEAIGIDQSSTGKLMRKLHNPSLEKLQKISEKTGIPAWELIAPIDENIYSSKNTEAWPFELITKSQFDSLTAKQQGAIEMAMLEAFEKITASHGKHHTG